MTISFKILAVAAAMSFASGPLLAQSYDVAGSSHAGIDPTGFGAGNSVGGDYASHGRIAFNLDKGMDALLNDRFDRAENAFSTVISLSPNNVKALILSGSTRELQGNWAGAADRYAAAAQHLPNNVYVLQLLGVAYAKSGQLDKAAGVKADLSDWAKMCAANCSDSVKLDAALAAIDGVS
jgi:tetratricopeptide (TPR) repeat protein